MRKTGKLRWAPPRLRKISGLLSLGNADCTDGSAPGTFCGNGGSAPSSCIGGTMAQGDCTGGGSVTCSNGSGAPADCISGDFH